MNEIELRGALRGLMKLAWRDFPAFVNPDHPRAELAQMMRKTSLWLEGFEPNPWAPKIEYQEFLGDGETRAEEGWEIVSADTPGGFRPCIGIGDRTLDGIRYRKPIATKEAP